MFFAVLLIFMIQALIIFSAAPLLKSLIPKGNDRFCKFEFIGESILVLSFRGRSDEESTLILVDSSSEGFTPPPLNDKTNNGQPDKLKF